MGKEKYQQLSKFLCYVLRHKPGDIHLLMDHQGFVNTKQLIKNVNEYTSYELNEDILQEIVDTDSKDRYEYTGDEIRCVQGHSIPWVDPKPIIKEPPAHLYHGTTMEAFELIKKDGEIKKMKRHAVHMQAEVSKAMQSAKRWSSSEPVVLVIDAHAMCADGYEFGISRNGVWLTDHVPTKYISSYIKESEESVIMDNSKLDVIRKAVHHWYEQLFAHVGGWSMKISQNDAGEDVFTGVYDYQIDIHLRGIMTDETYTVIDDDTDEEICFGIDSIDHIRYDHLTSIPKLGEATRRVPDFESEMLDDLYTEFIEDISEPDYDVYEKYFKLLPDGTYEFIGG